MLLRHDNAPVSYRIIPAQPVDLMTEKNLNMKTDRYSPGETAAFTAEKQKILLLIIIKFHVYVRNKGSSKRSETYDNSMQTKVWPDA